MDIAALKKEAKSKKTTATRLLELAKTADPTVQYAVAANPNTPLAALEYLSGHGKWTILKAVAVHPNVSLAILEILAAHKQVTVCVAVAESQQAPVHFLEQLTKHPEAAVRRAVAANTNCTDAIFTVLSEDSAYKVRYEVASRMSCPAAVLQKLAYDPEVSVRDFVAWNSGVPTTELCLLATDPEARVRASTVENLRRRGEMALLQTLARDPSEEVRFAIANLFIWNNLLHLGLIGDTSQKIRERLAEHHELPLEQMLILASDSSEQVRYAIARRDDLSKSVLEQLVKDSYVEVRRALVYAKTTRVPSWLLETLATDIDETVRWQVANNGSTPKAVLNKLLQDPSDDVRAKASETLKWF